MAPEQIRNDAVDRRADVYAAGVLLYEMTTGQRPFHSGHEVALMRAVLEDVVPPPRKLLPGYPAALELIVLKALAKDPGHRFQSAQELQSALEEFARASGLLLSNVPLSKFMGELFGDREDLYRQVLAGKRSVDDLPLDALVGSVAEPADHTEPGAAAGVEPSLPVPEPVTSGEHFVVSRYGPELMAVKVSGKLNERFAGLDLARALHGVVVMDLSKVERVTSFGVREWLQFVGQLGAVSALYYVGCSEAFVNQLSMVKRFMGAGQVLSFLAPHQCRTCQRTVPLLVDVASHAATLERPAMPPCLCPGCGKPAEFDDDVSAYLAFGPKAATGVPALVSQLARALTTAPPEPKVASDARTELIEKVLEPTCTRVRVKGLVTAGARWAKVFDGLEGDVVVDLTAAQTTGQSVVRELTVALEALGPETTSLMVLGAPRGLIEALAPVAEVRVGSALVEAACGACGASAARLVDLVIPAPVTCERCGATVDVGDVSWANPRARITTPPTAIRAVGPPLSMTPTRPNASRSTLTGLLVGAGALALLALALMLVPRAPAPQGLTAQPAATPAPAPVATTLPRWAAEGFTESDQGWTLVGRGEGATTDHARRAAVAAASARLGQLVDERQPPRVRELLKQVRARVGSAGPAIDPGHEEQAAEVPRPGGVEVALRFRLNAEARLALLAGATSPVQWRGVSLIDAPSDVGPEGALMVVEAAPDSRGLAAGLRPGDLVLECGGVELHGTAALRTNDPFAGKQVSCRVQAGGVTRSLRIAQ
jgi:hypothetical protein